MSTLIKTYCRFIFFLAISTIPLSYFANSQVCNGSWALQRPLSSQCVSGQWIGWQNTNDPVGCPTIPTYAGTEVNTFTFLSPVPNFAIDFKGFDATPGCARMEIRINGIFFPLTSANFISLPVGTTCTGSFNFMELTADGYLTSSPAGGVSKTGQGRLVFNNVNASSVTVSTNDGNGTIISNPFNCSVVPLSLQYFMAEPISDCKAKISWRSEIEMNVKQIEIERSENGADFFSQLVVTPLGSYSYYSFDVVNMTSAFFRLKIIDLDGTYRYSEIISVKSFCDKTGITIFPNPTSGILNIQSIKKNDQIIILDITGRKMYEPNAVNQLDLRSLSRGFYFLQIMRTNKVIATLKFMKN